MTQKGGDVEHEVKSTVSAFAKTFAKAEVTLNHKADLNISLTRESDPRARSLHRTPGRLARHLPATLPRPPQAIGTWRASSSCWRGTPWMPRR